VPQRASEATWTPAFAFSPICLAPRSIAKPRKVFGARAVHSIRLWHRSRDAKGDPDLGVSYADAGRLWHVRRLTPEERISDKISRRILSGDQGMIVWWSIGAGVHVEPHSHANEQIVWMLKGKMEFRLATEQRVCGPGDVVVIPGGAEHEAWFREDTEVIDFFAPPRDT
jgi:unsaturated pyranuronate lyase